MFFEQVLILFVVPFAGIPQSIHVFFNTFREDCHQGAADFFQRFWVFGVGKHFKQMYFGLDSKPFP